MLIYAITLFTSAFLLFLVEPLLGRYILPWYGGAPSVWTTCMLVFQALLLAGYAYAHLLASRLPPRKQVWLHLCVLAAALACMPVAPSESWKPIGSEIPSLRIIGMLLSCVGIPFVALSATGPLLQSWLGLRHPGRSPYVLYSLSNVGSLLALLAYPLWIEPALGRSRQTLFWSLAFVGFAVLCALCAWGIRKSPSSSVGGTENAMDAANKAPEGENISFAVQSLWLLLPACASALLLAATNVLCQDVAVIPFLWVLPLSLYLLSFILTFAGEAWYSRIGFGSVLVSGSVFSIWMLGERGTGSIEAQIGLACTVLFAACTVCHGELFKLRPGSRHLTRYYLVIALGGCLGGVFVALIAPLAFTSHSEWPLSLGCCLFLFGWVCLTGEKQFDEQGWRVFSLVLFLSLSFSVLKVATWLASVETPNSGFSRLMPRIGMAVGGNLEKYMVLFCAFSGWLIWRRVVKSRRFWHLLNACILFTVFTGFSCLMLHESHSSRAEVVSKSRGFYGILTLSLYKTGTASDEILVLRNGNITHGMQFTAAEMQDTPTTYYTERSGVGLILAKGSTGKPRKIAVVGLGAGTLASYGRAGDTMRFYEINPAVIEIARNKFSFLSRSKAHVETALGDARLSFEREAPQNYDLIVLDAFSGDAIPIHLLTKEAFQVYLGHLRTGGVIAVHISNRYLDLEPVVEKLRRNFGLQSVSVSHFTHPEKYWDFGSFWVLLSMDADNFAGKNLQEQAYRSDARIRDVPLWTDDYASVLPLLR
jgi:spermidine synthase